MSELTKRLRKQELSNELPDDGLCDEAADRIDELEAENKRLHYLFNKWGWHTWRCQSITDCTCGFEDAMKEMNDGR